MSYNLRNSLTTIFLISLILVINLIVALAATRETIKRNTDDQDDEWMSKQKLGADLAYNSGPDDQTISLERLVSLLNPRYRGGGGRWPSTSVSPSSSLSPFNFEKRQIRYHQCYFNPISCFRRRK